MTELLRKCGISENGKNPISILNSKTDNGYWKNTLICKESPIDNNVVLLRFQEIWRYSNVTCAMYPLAPLDTIGPGGKPSKIAKTICEKYLNREKFSEI